MSLLVLGGHDRMESIYRQEAHRFGIKTKIFTYGRNDIAKSIGGTDGILIFTGTVSHKIVNSIKKDAKKKNIPLILCHNSSKNNFVKAIEDFVKSN